jgi:hypothetical protein
MVRKIKGGFMIRVNWNEWYIENTKFTLLYNS